MVKPVRRNKGFTFLELLLVLSMLSLFFLFHLPNYDRLTLKLYGLSLIEMITHEQYQCLKGKKVTEFSFEKDQFCIEEDCEKHLQGIVMDELSFRINQSGNISRAFSVCLYLNESRGCIVAQLGSGRLRYE